MDATSSVPAGATIELLDEVRGLPLVVTLSPESGAADQWASEHASWIDAALLRHGAVLFRKLALSAPDDFGRFVGALHPEVPVFKEESSPRTQVSSGVFTSTDYNARYPIQFHNEYSYSNEWPMKLFFGCTVPAATGGETPIASSRRVLARLSARTREAFETRGVRYVRNYVDGIGVSWREAFGTERREDVEEICRQSGIEAEWKEDRLTTRQVGAAVVAHPRTGEAVWFNHGFFFNINALEPAELRAAVLATMSEEDYSTHTYFGDGGRIEDEMIEEIRSAYAEESVSFRWARGDVLLIDNMLTAHSRRPYGGARTVLVAMRQRCVRHDLSVRDS